MKASALAPLLLAPSMFALACDSGDGDGSGDGGTEETSGGETSSGEASSGEETGAGACPEPTGAGTEHQGRIEADETWTAAASPHVVVFDVSIVGATITVEPCAVVRIRKGFSFAIGGTPGGEPAALIARGEAERPITFERDDDAQPWGSIRPAATGSIDLEHVRLRGGGDPDTAQASGGIIVAFGAAGNMGITKNVRLVDVTVENSAGFGVNLQQRSAFSDDSTGLVITGSGMLPSGSNVDTSYPLFVEGASISSIPPGTYTGNAKDEILIGVASSLLDEEVTFHERGLPYHLLTDFSMAPMTTAAEGGLSTLTIEAGVTIRFNNGGPSASYAMTLGASSGVEPENIRPVRLIAAGTADAPITLTSAEDAPAAGDWGSLEWSGGPPTGNVMTHVKIEYAGGDSGTLGFGCGPADNDAALIFRNWRPDELFITDSTFSDSAAGGIVSGWYSDEDGPDFSGNDFVNIANGCNVSRWANDDRSCPGEPPICL